MFGKMPIFNSCVVVIRQSVLLPAVRTMGGLPGNFSSPKRGTFGENYWETQRFASALEYRPFFFLFSFGVLQLMLPEVPQPYGLLYCPRIEDSNFPPVPRCHAP